MYDSCTKYSNFVGTRIPFIYSFLCCPLRRPIYFSPERLLLLSDSSLPHTKVSKSGWPVANRNGRLDGRNKTRQTVIHPGRKPGALSRPVSATLVKKAEQHLLNILSFRSALYNRSRFFAQRPSLAATGVARLNRWPTSLCKTILVRRGNPIAPPVADAHYERGMASKEIKRFSGTRKKRERQKRTFSKRVPRRAGPLLPGSEIGWRRLRWSPRRSRRK